MTELSLNYLALGKNLQNEISGGKAKNEKEGKFDITNGLCQAELIAIDTNEDGSISEEEFKAAYTKEKGSEYNYEGYWANYTNWYKANSNTKVNSDGTYTITTTGKSGMITKSTYNKNGEMVSYTTTKKNDKGEDVISHFSVEKGSDKKNPKATLTKIQVVSTDKNGNKITKSYESKDDYENNRPSTITDTYKHKSEKEAQTRIRYYSYDENGKQQQTQVAYKYKNEKGETVTDYYEGKRADNDTQPDRRKTQNTDGSTTNTYFKGKKYNETYTTVTTTDKKGVKTSEFYKGDEAKGESYKTKTVNPDGTYTIIDTYKHQDEKEAKTRIRYFDADGKQTEVHYEYKNEKGETVTEYYDDKRQTGEKPNRVKTVSKDGKTITNSYDKNENGVADYITVKTINDDKSYTVTKYDSEKAKENDSPSKITEYDKNGNKIKQTTITTKGETVTTPVKTTKQTKDGGYDVQTTTQSKTIEVTTETTETYDNDKVTSKTVKETKNGKTTETTYSYTYFSNSDTVKTTTVIENGKITSITIPVESKNEKNNYATYNFKYNNDGTVTCTMPDGKTKTIKKEVLHEFILKLTSDQAKIR